MKNKQQKPPHVGMILEQRDWMYHSELNDWMRRHPTASAVEVEEMHRRLAKKWRV